MEVIVVWLFTMFAIGSELEMANDKTNLLEAEVFLMETKAHDQKMMIKSQAEEIAHHEEMIIKLAARHAALYARDKVEKDRIAKSIQVLTDELNALKFSASKDRKKTSTESVTPSVSD
jgi:hypothetical protein